MATLAGQSKQLGVDAVAHLGREDEEGQGIGVAGGLALCWLAHHSDGSLLVVICLDLEMRRSVIRGVSVTSCRKRRERGAFGRKETAGSPSLSPEFW